MGERYSESQSWGGAKPHFSRWCSLINIRKCRISPANRVCYSIGVFLFCVDCLNNITMLTFGVKVKNNIDGLAGKYYDEGGFCYALPILWTVDTACTAGLFLAFCLFSFVHGFIHWGRPKTREFDL